MVDFTFHANKRKQGYVNSIILLHCYIKYTSSKLTNLLFLLVLSSSDLLWSFLQPSKLLSSFNLPVPLSPNQVFLSILMFSVFAMSVSVQLLFILALFSPLLFLLHSQPITIIHFSGGLCQSAILYLVLLHQDLLKQPSLLVSFPCFHVCFQVDTGKIDKNYLL